MSLSPYRVFTVSKTLMLGGDTDSSVVGRSCRRIFVLVTRILRDDFALFVLLVIQERGNGQTSESRPAIKEI